MQRNTLFSFLTIAALGLLTAGPSYAGTFTWKTSPEDKVFQNENNWTGSGFRADVYPTAGDTVTIQATTNDKDPEISHNEIFATLTINRNGELTVTGANTLTISGSSHTLNGNLVLQDNDSMVKFTYPQSSGWITLAGSGGIVGENGGAELQLADAKIDSDVDIEGKMVVMKFSGDTATFKNGGSGIVLANVSGTLQFASGLTLESESGSSFEAKTNSSAELQFNQAATTNMAGDFVLCGDATIRFNAAIDTTGCYDEGIADGWIRGTGNNFFCHDDDNCGGGGANANCFSSDQEFTGSCS